MFFVHKSDIGEKGVMKSYFFKRFVRIYPFYWLVLIPIALAYFLVPSMGSPEKREWLVILSSFLLVHTGSVTVIDPAWTLYYEVMFYLVFSFVIWNGVRGFFLLAIWAVLGIVGAIFFDGNYTRFYFSEFNLLFVFGVVAAKFFGDNAKWERSSIVIGGVLFCGAIVAERAIGGPVGDSFFYRCENVLLGLASMLVIYALVSFERNKKLAFPKVLLSLGNASFAIYIIHMPLQTLVLTVLMRRVHVVSQFPTLLYVGVLIVSLWVGNVFHLLFEKPLLRFLRRRLALSTPSKPQIVKIHQETAL